MTKQSVIHDTFVIERTYPTLVSRVFAAFTTQEAKDAWGDTGDLDPTEPGADEGRVEFDFRPGGHERFSFGYQGVAQRYDATYYDIVPEQRIIYSYEMYADGMRSSVSIVTIEFAPMDGGTALTWTEQGAYLDGIDGAEAPQLRRYGVSELLDGLAKSLMS
ncbi:MAG TPA: SRPBCC domain-containing protein [Ktedonobacterales bacterium]|nr:SRPBCC domain-containing protein [Ktedonobacterales bacterium]